MNIRQKTSGAGRSLTMTIMIGAAIAIMITILLAAGASMLILNGILDESKMWLAAYITMFLAILISTVLSTWKIEDRIAIIDVAIAAIYLFVLITINIIFFNGSFSRLWIGLAVVIAAVAVSMLLSAKGKKQKTRRYKRYR